MRGPPYKRVLSVPRDFTDIINGNRHYPIDTIEGPLLYHTAVSPTLYVVCTANVALRCSVHTAVRVRVYGYAARERRYIIEGFHVPRKGL